MYAPQGKNGLFDVRYKTAVDGPEIRLTAYAANGWEAEAIARECSHTRIVWGYIRQYGRRLPEFSRFRDTPTETPQELERAA